MEKFVPYEKLSKAKKKQLNAERRVSWAIDPVTRKSRNPRAYDRNRAKNFRDDFGSLPCLFNLE